MENPKKSILPAILKTVGLVFLAIFSIAGAASAYIVFAPDNLPKPFYLQYIYPGQVLPDGSMVQPQSMPQPQPQPQVQSTYVQEDHEFVSGEGIMIDTGTKIVNLADLSGKKFIKIKIVIEVAPSNAEYNSLPEEEKTAYITEFTNEITNKLPLIEDAIITHISTKTYDQIFTSDGKEGLRQELSSLITQRLPEYHILSVLFTEFVVE